MSEREKRLRQKTADVSRGVGKYKKSLASFAAGASSTSIELRFAVGEAICGKLLAAEERIVYAHDKPQPGLTALHQVGSEKIQVAP
jgi:hypothetical protein